MQGTQVPKIMELMRHVWFAMALMLLLTFVFKVTGFTAQAYGALPAAGLFLVLTLMVLYTILFATSKPGHLLGPRE